MICHSSSRIKTDHKKQTVYFSVIVVLWVAVAQW